jgi:hypothetical protein
MQCHELVVLPPQLERFLLAISSSPGAPVHKGSQNMLIKILLLTILVGSIALSAHRPAWGDLAKRKSS